MPQHRAEVALHLADGSSSISTWTSFRLSRRYDQPLDDYVFEFAPPPKKRAELYQLTAKGQKVSITIDGAPQATGVITDRQRRIGPHGVTIQIQAHSLLHAAYQASVDPFLSKSTKAETPLKTVVLDVLRNFGFDSIETDASADVTAISGKSLSGRNPPVVLDELTQKDIQSETGQTAYAFCARLFTRYGLALRTNNEGKLLLGSPDFNQSFIYTVVADRGRVAGDHMLLEDGIEESDSNDEQFSEIVVTGKTSGQLGTKSASAPVSGVFCPPPSGATRPSGIPFPNANLLELPAGRHTYSSALQPFKPKYWTDKKSASADRCQQMAATMAGKRAFSGYQVKHSVRGLISLSGRRAVWAVDTVGRVVVDEWGLDEDMYLYAVQQSQDRGGGQKTMLTWIPLGSLVLTEA